MAGKRIHLGRDRGGLNSGLEIGDLENEGTKSTIQYVLGLWDFEHLTESLWARQMHASGGA